MANNDPSPADIARLQKEQEAMEQRERDRELQAEFDEADRVERERLTKQKNYDLERERVERERVAQARKDKFQMERANVESRKESDRKLQAEFDASDKKQKEHERSEKERSKQSGKDRSLFARADKEHAKAEDSRIAFSLSEHERKERESNGLVETQKRESASYAKAHPKAFTGIGVVDRYLDKADSASETSASKHRIERQRAIEKAEKGGQITPEYSSFLKRQSDERYEKEKVPFARSIVGYGVESVKGLDKYIPVKNQGGFAQQLGRPTPARMSTAKTKTTGRAPVKKFGKSFSTGISMEPAFPSEEHKVTHGTNSIPFSAQLPHFAGPGFHAPQFAPTVHKKIATLSPKVPNKISPKLPGLNVTPPKFGESTFGKQTHTAHKGGVSLGLNLESNMFGEKKGKSKKKLFDW